MEKQEEIWQAVGRITVNFPLLGCDKCAITVMRWLKKRGIEAKIIEFINLDGKVDDVLDKLKHLAVNLPQAEGFNLGVSELEAVIDGVKNLGVPAQRFCIDLSIARGLNYYTGTVYETTLIGHESLGSICSGGRYEELVGIFLGEKMPGVGISIGLSRLINRLLKADILQKLPPTPAQVMVVNIQEDLMPIYLQV